MEVSPGPKDSNDNILESLKGLLKDLMGEDGLAFLDLDNAIASVEQGQSIWQAPFAIGLCTLPFLYHYETDIQREEVPIWAFIVLGLASQIHMESKDATVSDLACWALEPLQASYASLSAEIPGYRLSDEQAHTLFHTRFALGVLLLAKGDEEQAKTILREMAETKTAIRGQSWSSEGLRQSDVGETKALAAIILQDFYARRQDYELALYLLTEAVASCGPGLLSEGLLAVVPRLLELFAERCERLNDFWEWVGLFDRAAAITEICGEADVSGELPSECKIASPQFLAWKFGQLVARFAIRNSPSLGNSKMIVPNGYQDRETMEESILSLGGYGDDWLNGTMVASLLLECDERRNWQILRQQYVSMWESLPRYQWLSLCEAGTQTDLYWAMRIGFADQMISTKEQIPIIQCQTELSTIIRDMEMTRDAASTIALRQLKEQQDLAKILELTQKLIERQPPSRAEICQQLQQRLIAVWNKLPATVVDYLVKAEKHYMTGVDTADAKLYFRKAVEESFHCCLREPLVSFMQKHDYETIAISFSSQRGVERKTLSTLHRLSLGEWTDILKMLSVSKGTEDLKRFMKEQFGELSSPALRQLSRSLHDFCHYSKNCAHPDIPRCEEVWELEQMRDLALGIKRPSVITQIFQLFISNSPNKS